MDRSADRRVPRPLFRTPLPVREIKRGDLVEGFRVMSELGKGAASTIYLVQDPRTKQVWCLKHVEKEHAKDQRFLDQAESEYRIGSGLRHPGLRRIEKLIKIKRKLLSVRELFLVMELVDGTPLDQNPPKTFTRAVSIFQQIAEALSSMHDQGFVHADMKPNNVIVSDEGKVKIIDLGQSCRVGTVKERIQGTPDYIAPEQVHRRPITAKTDIYNLGATMYWVLTGKPIPTALATKPDALLGSLDDSMIQKPTPAVELNHRIELRLNDLIMQCVEVDAEKRPADMRYVADRLNLILGILRAKPEAASVHAEE